MEFELNEADLPDLSVVDSTLGDPWLDQLVTQSAGGTVTVSGYLINPFHQALEIGRIISISSTPLQSVFTVVHHKDLYEFLAVLNTDIQQTLNFLKFHPTGPLTGRIPGQIAQKRLIFEVMAIGNSNPSQAWNQLNNRFYPGVNGSHAPRSNFVESLTRFSRQSLNGTNF